MFNSDVLINQETLNYGALHNSEFDTRVLARQLAHESPARPGKLACHDSGDEDAPTD